MEDGESYNTWKQVTNTGECRVGTSIVTKRWDVCSRTKTFKSALDRESLGISFLVVGQQEGLWRHTRKSLVAYMFSLG